MHQRLVGRPPEFAYADRRHISEAVDLLKEKRVRSLTAAFHLVAEANGIFDQRLKRSFAERLRLRHKTEVMRCSSSTQGSHST